MRQVLFILGELADEDVEWMVDVGSRRSLESGAELVREGQPIDALYFILQGRFDVVTHRQTVAVLGVGQVVGELSFLDSRPPIATLVAQEPSVVLAIPRRRLNEKLHNDPYFAARFYKALGVFLADRLRATTTRLASGADRDPLDEDVEGEDEISPDVLDNLELAGARFDRILKRMLAG